MAAERTGHRTDRAALDAAFAATPRARFLPEAQQRFADLDRPLPIGFAQTNSQPSTVREMVALLDVHPGHRVLDVGSGSGWTTALLAHLVGPTGRVVGVEVVPELVELGRRHLAGVPLPARAEIRQARRGVLGVPDLAPFDRVLVSAQASSLPEQLVAQLAVGGTLVAPVAGHLTVVRRTEAGAETDRLGAYSFVPLVEDQ